MHQVFTHYSYHYTHYYTTIHYLSQPLPKSSYIGPPITFLICAPSSTLGLDRRKWKGLSNRGLISPSLLSIWKWASTHFISRLLTLAPYSRSSDTARGKKKHSPLHPPPPPRKREKNKKKQKITCWNWLFLGNPYTIFSIYNILPYQEFHVLIWNYPDISRATLNQRVSCGHLFGIPISIEVSHSVLRTHLPLI